MAVLVVLLVLEICMHYVCEYWGHGEVRCVEGVDVEAKSIFVYILVIESYDMEGRGTAVVIDTLLSTAVRFILSVSVGWAVE
jgi:hypothetical protein